MDAKLHCTPPLRKAASKARHKLLATCQTVRQVLTLNPGYGVPVGTHPHLRKMRVVPPDLNVGKSHGYRLIYRARTIDQTVYIVLLATYYKSDVSDLTKQQYDELLQQSDQAFRDPTHFD